MKKFDLYLIREHISPFLAGLFTFTILLLLNRVYQLMDLIIRKGVPLFAVLKIFLYSLPFILAMTVSMALLISALVAYGKLAQDFEIMAFKSLGISFKRTLLGPIVFASLVFIFMCWFNDKILPEANHRVKNLIFSVYAKKPAVKIREGVFTDINNYLVYVSKKDERTGRLREIKILETARGKEGPKTIVARDGMIKSIGDTLVVFVLQNGVIYESLGKKGEDFREIRFKKQVLEIKVNTEMQERDRKFRTEREMTVKMLLNAMKEKDREIEKTDPRDVVRIKILKRLRNRYLVEVHKKFSLPFAGIVFIVLGAALATITKKGGYGAAFGFSFLVFTIYYVFLIGGEELARRGYVSPFLAMWFPDFLFLIISVILVRRCEG